MENHDERWRGDEGPRALTWGAFLEGRSFFETANRLTEIGSSRSILEIGPGYGRLQKALSEVGLRYDQYVGVDLSEARIGKLAQELGNEKTQFISGDARTVDLSGFEPFDLLISSATFEHISPDFSLALSNIKRFLSLRAVAAFDLIDVGRNEGHIGTGQQNTYVRRYTLDEVYENAERAGFQFVGALRFSMSSTELEIDPEKLVRKNIHSRQDGQVALIHRLMAVVRL